MQKFKVAKKWNEKLSKFDGFKIEEREKVIMGKLSLSKKVNNVYENHSISFVVFKNKVTQETIEAVLSLEFWAEDFQISFSSFLNDKKQNQKYIQLIINQAIPANKEAKESIRKVNIDDLLDNSSLHQDDEIPF